MIKPYYDHAGITIYNGENLPIMQELPDNSVDSIVTDPPYGIKFMGKKWDYQVPSVETWQEALRILKPGGHALVACGTRTQHRMVVNLEDAGFEIRDIIAWVYGSGFPKSLNISKAIDKAAGQEKVIGTIPDRWTGKGNTLNFSTDRAQSQCKITESATLEAQQWEGWGTALKPSVEYWTLAQKPLDSSSDIDYSDCIKEVIKCLLQSLVIIAGKNSMSNLPELKEDVNIVQWIAEGNTNTLEDLLGLMGILQSYITESMNLSIVLSWLNTLAEIWKVVNTPIIKTELSLITELKILKSLEWESIFQNIMQARNSSTNGLNVNVLDAVSLFNVSNLKLKDIHSRYAQENALSVQLDPNVNFKLWTLCRKPLSEKTVAANVLKWGTGGINIDDCRVGLLKDEDTKRVKGGHKTSYIGGNLEKNFDIENQANRDLGRFPANLMHDGSDEVMALFPETKSGAIKPHYKNQGIEHIGTFKIRDRSGENNISASSGSAARFFYCAKASKSERGKGNDHPTVKPLKLISYLITLVTPLNGIVFDFYGGSGTTAKAAKRLNRKAILIDKDSEYVEMPVKQLAQEVLPFN